MILLWIILIIITQICKCIFCTYHCTMNSFEVTCTGLNETQLIQPMVSILNKTDVTSLNITNGFMKIISQDMFKEFVNLQSLYITYSQVEYLEQDAFDYNPDLQELCLNNNALKEFNINAHTSLKKLNLDHNKLKEFSEFNLSYFPQLDVLNLEHNLLSSLPKSLINKLKEENNFYLLANNNPWNCTHPDWSEYLNEKLIKAFCSSNNNYEAFKENNLQYEETTTFFPLIENANKTVQCENADCTRCSFYYCIWWFFCGIWIGIIIGNIGKIRLLLFSRAPIYQDESTQCEYSLVEQHMISGIFDVKSRKLVPESTLMPVNTSRPSTHQNQ